MLSSQHNPSWDQMERASWLSKIAEGLPSLPTPTMPTMSRSSLQRETLKRPRLAIPRNTGKQPGMGGEAKNPVGNQNNFNQRIDAAIQNPMSTRVTKMASMSPEEAKRKRHAYYMRNRAQIRLRNKRWRQQNPNKVRLARTRYQRALASGSRRQGHRVRNGNSYVTYGGF